MRSLISILLYGYEQIIEWISQVEQMRARIEGLEEE
jgi:hypothetical protein